MDNLSFNLLSNFDYEPLKKYIESEESSILDLNILISEINRAKEMKQEKILIRSVECLKYAHEDGSAWCENINNNIDHQNCKS